MSVAEFFVFIAAGRAITWLGQNNGLTKPLWRLHPLLKKLGECDLCLGFWVFLGLASVLQVQPFDLWAWWIEAIVLACISAIITHVLRIGWQSKFGVTIIE